MASAPKDKVLTCSLVAILALKDFGCLVNDRQEGKKQHGRCSAAMV